MSSARSGSWGSQPTRRLLRRVTAPADSSVSTPAKARSSVDLPDPLGPTTAQRAPFSSVRFSSSNWTRSPSLLLVKPVAHSRGSPERFLLP
jgi:hypothetical protein